MPPGESLRPMLATAGAPPVGPGWAVEFKWDGVRALVEVRGGVVRLLSRNGNDVTGGYPELVAALPTDRDLVLDGEIVALDASGRSDFGLLQHRMHVRSPGAALLAEVPVELYVFDLLELDGVSTTGDTYDVRRARLAELGADTWPRVSVPPAFTDITPAQGLEVARAQRLEGIVAKRRSARYEPGRRSAAWVKTALFHPQEVVLGGWTAGRGNRGSTLGALLMGAYDESGRLRYLGNVGSGFSEATLRRLLELLRPLARADSPFDEEIPRELRRGVTWVRPTLVGEVEYRTLTHDRRLRHTVWRGLRPDRDAAEIVLGDAPADLGPTSDELAALDALPAHGTWAVGGRELTLTDLDAVLFPGPPPVTRRDLVRYHARIAPHLLPYLAGGPVELRRFPEDGPTPPAPGWVRFREGDSGRHPVLDSVASLVWVAAGGAAELRPWASRPSDVHSPTWALIDVEPGPASGFADVLVLARLFRTALDHLGLDGMPVVDGLSGLQIRVPVREGATFADTRRWVERLSSAVGGMVPELVSRRGIRLDPDVNALDRRLVAPFSVRPGRQASVAVPVTWAELDDPELRPDRWTVHTVLARLAETGDPLRPLIGRAQQLPAL